MTTLTVTLLALAGATLVAPGVLTTQGARRRGARWPLAVASGLVFPLTWAIWYVQDVHPYASGRHP